MSISIEDAVLWRTRRLGTETPLPRARREPAMKVRDILSDETRWTQGAVALDANGDCVMATDKAAVCWCLYGAIERCYRADRGSLALIQEVAGRVRRRLHDSSACSITRWNDVPGRTFEQIRALVADLDI